MFTTFAQKIVVKGLLLSQGKGLKNMRFLHSSTEMNNNLLEGIIRKRIFLLRQMRQEPEVITVKLEFLSPVSCLPHLYAQRLPRIIPSAKPR